MIVDGISLNLQIIIFFTFGYFEKISKPKFFTGSFTCVLLENVLHQNVLKLKKENFICCINKEIL